MNAYIDNENSIVVELTRRNLRALLAKLDGHPPNSACTLQKQNQRYLLTVKAVEDDWHYSFRLPGQLHPDTQGKINADGV